MKILLVTRPMPAGPFIEAIRGRAPELDLLEYGSALGDADLADVDVVLGWQMPPGLPARAAAPALGLLGCRRSREAARARPGFARARLAHRRSRAGSGDRPVRRRDGVAPRARPRALRGATARSRLAAPADPDRTPSRRCPRHRRDRRRDRRLARALRSRRARLEPALAGKPCTSCSARATSSFAPCR